MTVFSIVFMLASVSAGAWNWQALAPLSQPRAGYGAGVIKNQLVIAGGGLLAERTKNPDRSD